MEEDVRKETLKRVAHELAMAGQKQNAPLSEEQIATLLIQKLMTVIPEVTEVRPQSLECDVVRFQNNKEKWVENKRGYKTTVEGLSEKFNPEYWNYAKLISGVLRYRMPLEHVIKLVGSLSLKDESINTWKIGVERALKKYLPGMHDEDSGESAD